jgi:hypothetical protein
VYDPPDTFPPVHRSLNASIDPVFLPPVYLEQDREQKKTIYARIVCCSTANKRHSKRITPLEGSIRMLNFTLQLRGGKNYNFPVF